MADAVLSLDSVETGYAVFERDQILTHNQLNTLARYLDDQDRLTRVGLLGVGIACGLRVSIAATKDSLTLLPGAGVTTDGDLVVSGSDRVYSHYRPYDPSAPTYGPFIVNGARIPLFELIPDGLDGGPGPDAIALGQFTGNTGLDLANAAAILLVESSVKDDDLCTATDCDNLGKRALNQLKLLLLDKRTLPADVSPAGLDQTMPTPDLAGRRLQPLVAERPVLTAAMTTPAAIGLAYRAVCNRIHARLTAALSGLFGATSVVVDDLFDGDPGPGWVAKLTTFGTTFSNTDTGIQYYYDFLRDLVETYNDYCGLLIGDTAVCCPPLKAFPKHLALGNVIADADGADNRTGFYPSPLAQVTAGQRAHARALAWKLHTLINTFVLPAAGQAAVVVTPSRGLDRPLEERAIPFYYRVTSAMPIQRAWNHDLTRRGLERTNYIYARDAALGAAADPFAFQINGCQFFRVEGHLGRPIADALKVLTDEIAARNLPFTVRAVHVGVDRTVVVRPPIRYTDLSRFHRLLRKDIATQIDDVAGHATTIREKVIGADTIAQADKTVATEQETRIMARATAARGKFVRNYTQYVGDTSLSWQTEVQATVSESALLKTKLDDVARTNTISPIDSLLGSNHVEWIGWLDQIIREKDDADDDKLLFQNFITQHPAAEHLGGVERGGTLVLIHDSSRIVVGDVALPYWWPDVAEPAPAEPPLPPPVFKPPVGPDKGIKILPAPFDPRVIDDKLIDFRRNFVDPIGPKALVDFQATQTVLQRGYVQALKDATDLVVRVSTPAGDRATAPTFTAPIATDPRLNIRLVDVQTNQEIVETLRNQMADPAVAVDTTAQTKLQSDLKVAEVNLANSVAETTKFVAASVPATSTDASLAMKVVGDAVSQVRDKEATTVVTKSLTNVSKTTTVDPVLENFGHRRT